MRQNKNEDTNEINSQIQLQMLLKYDAMLKQMEQMNERLESISMKLDDNTFSIIELRLSMLKIGDILKTLLIPQEKNTNKI